MNTVLRLVLEWNALGVWEESFSLFCDGLASNNTLTHLDLRNNQINHHGASELALALRRNSTLQELGEVELPTSVLTNRRATDMLTHLSMSEESLICCVCCCCSSPDVVEMLV